MRTWVSAVAVGCVVAVALLNGVVPAEGQSARTRTSASTVPFAVTLDSGPGGYVGGDADYEFDNSNAQLQASAAADGRTFDVTSAGNNFSLTFGAPKGQRLHDGFYRSASNYLWSSPGGVPNISVTGDGRGCDSTTGSFDVRDLRTVGGAISRLDLTYYAFCGDGDQDPAEMGEVRVGEPQPAGVTVSSSALMWGTTDAGITSLIPAAVTTRNTSSKALPVVKPTVTGFGASSFQVVSDSCGTELVSPAGSSFKKSSE